MSEPARVSVQVVGAVGTIRLDDPDTRNALTNDTLREIAAALADFDAAAEVCAAVIAGSDRVFASGADLNALAELDTIDYYFGERARLWDGIRATRLPVVAAVSGFCLGAGCELALMSDIIVASESAQFGLPETKLGLIPGAGGTQRLARAIGKAKTMDVVLSGRLLSAEEALAAGLIARVAGEEGWFEEAAALAAEIASRSSVATRLAKGAVNTAFEAPLEVGLEVERKSFAIALGSEPARKGIAEFLQRRSARDRS
ncbi:MAG TPA: enoyl-CoA hydratase-related protein [Solirubrobacteraceae bacterium]